MENENSKTERMTFFRSWRDTAREEITDPVERCAFYDALIDYGLDGVIPSALTPLVRIAFLMAKPVLEKSANMRRPGNKNATKNANETQLKRNEKRKHLLEEEVEVEIEEEKEKEVEKGNISRVCASKTNNSFKKWNLEQFNESVSKVLTENPELLPFRDAFADYWTEKSASGIYRFALQQTWDTSLRLKRWGRHNRSQQGDLFNKRTRATFAGDEFAGKEERDGF